MKYRPSLNKKDAFQIMLSEDILEFDYIPNKQRKGIFYHLIQIGLLSKDVSFFEDQTTALDSFTLQCPCIVKRCSSRRPRPNDGGIYLFKGLLIRNQGHWYSYLQ